MARVPQPLFDTFSRFHDLNFLNLSAELPSVREFLGQFPTDCKAVDGYLAVRSFLKSYGGNEATFNSYRTHVERLLLWSLMVAKIPLLEMRRSHGEAFIEFCNSPDQNWIGPVVKSRFVRIGGRKKLDTDTYQVNPDWRPFNLTVSKSERKAAAESGAELHFAPYSMSQGSKSQVFAVCGSFFQYCIQEGLTEVNPIQSIKQKSKYIQRTIADTSGRSLTQLQWEFVIDTAELMAAEDPEHERTLFILVTMFSMYLRVSDIVGRDNWVPTMGDIRRDSNGDWFFHVVGKGNKAAKISVKDEYIQVYLSRYRQHLNLSPLPAPYEKTPLVATLKGRAGLSDRHIRLILQEVFDRALERMKEERRTVDEIAQLRSASLHWLRHTSATFDAPFREMKDLQADLRHEQMSTTENVYYNSLDEQRAGSMKGLKIRR